MFKVNKTSESRVMWNSVKHHEFSELKVLGVASRNSLSSEKVGNLLDKPPMSPLLVECSVGDRL